MNDRPGEAALAPAEPVLRREVRDGVAALVLNRPRQYNALSRALLQALHEALDAVADDENVRVVTITGAGFMTGATVTFDGAPANVSNISSTSIAATTPAHTKGVVDVVVKNSNGQSATLPQSFTYQ